MPDVPCTASVRALSDYASVNLRDGPGLHNNRIGTINVGVSGLVVLEVQSDEFDSDAVGQVYQWFQVRLADGSIGWLRDDMIDIVGACGSFGYDLLTQPTFANALERNSDGEIFDSGRIRQAAYNITAAFEGSGYASYQNTDAGIVSYGRFQFTLASGSLFAVIDKYLALERADDFVASNLRKLYAQRVQNRDELLRSDKPFRSLLTQAATSPAMQLAQDRVATEMYWERVQEMNVQPRGIVTALGQAFLFDSGIQHGVYNDLLAQAEQQLGLPAGAHVGTRGISEQRLIAVTAAIRRDRLVQIAAGQNLGGLIVRGNFWVSLCAQGDWNLQGDDQGLLLVKPGLTVPVRSP